MHVPQRHPGSDDRLFRQIVECELDECADLPAAKRDRCIVQVLQRMDAEIQEHLAGADLSPDALIRDLRAEVRRAAGEHGSVAA